MGAPRVFAVVAACVLSAVALPGQPDYDRAAPLAAVAATRGTTPVAAAAERRLSADSCEDSQTWRHTRTCAWVGEKPAKRCKVKDEAEVSARDACPAACDTCLADGEDGEPSCADSTTWYKGSKKGQECAWVGEKPAKRCKAKSKAKVLARDACPAACDTCPADATLDVLTSDKRVQKNYVYVKVPKAASSTTGGIIRHIAAVSSNASGTRDDHWIEDEPGVWANHRPYTELRDAIQALTMPTVLIGSLRDPFERAISQFFHFECSRSRAHDASDDAILRYVSSITPNFQTQYLGLMHPKRSPTYQALIVVERYDESLFLLAQDLGLPWNAVLYVHSKDSSENACHHPQTLTPRVRQYRDEVFRPENGRDYHLWRRTVEDIDHRIARHRPKFREFQALVNRTIARCPFDWKDCYWDDNGCSIQCIHGVYIDDLLKNTSIAV